MRNKIKQLMYDGKEKMDFTEYEYLAKFGETNLIERKTICNFHDLGLEENKKYIKEMLSKEVSAFANYCGGIILIGCNDEGIIEEGTDNTFGNKTKREWLTDIVYTCVSPKISEFSVKTAIDTNGMTHFVIVIDDIRMPRQGCHGKSSYKYYSRVDCKSQPIDGLMVVDIFNRQTQAELRPIFNIRSVPEGWNSPQVAFFDISIENTSLITAEKVCMLIKASKSLFSGNGSRHGVQWDSEQIQCNVDIVYPKVPTRFGAEKDNILKLVEFEKVVLFVTLVAKNMLAKEFIFELVKPNTIIRIK